MSNYTEHMTPDMLNVIISDDDLVAEYKMCHKKHKEALAASNIILPATAASGAPVVHGARKCISEVAEYWNFRMNAAFRLIPPNRRRELNNE